MKVKTDENGLATAALEIYTTDQILGVPGYSIAFISLEVSGEKSNYGIPGNWPVWGVMNNETTLSSFKHFYNYPYHFEDMMTIEEKEDGQVATVGANGGEGLTVNLRKKPITQSPPRV